ncbi:MAG: hypothetical protein EAZ74_07090, partial [Alphaproteobacteria bacterium]
DPAGIIAQAQRLTEAGDFVAIHFDRRANAGDFAQITAALKGHPNVVFTKRRIKCGWGEWSLVEATLEAVKAAVHQFPSASHFYMLSGDCMPIKSARHVHEFLDREDVDYIESFDFFASDWIKVGLKEERLIYRHWFNERSHKSLFYAAMNLQKRLGLQREIPSDIAMQIGSQWWCLRRRTIEWLLDFIKKHNGWFAVIYAIIRKNSCHRRSPRSIIAITQLYFYKAILKVKLLDQFAYQVGFTYTRHTPKVDNNGTRENFWHQVPNSYISQKLIYDVVNTNKLCFEFSGYTP